MASEIVGVFNDKLQEKIKNSRILVVGAGGIGCEVLKNLVLSGFNDIEIIDLDTIDVSNLNRQFLFHKEHVGQSKAKVAKASALSFNPNVKITAHHDSITETKYGASFFKQFNIVLNALDNRQARNHVNRMCLTAEVPLIESGTAGYNGQVELIKKGLTTCYECTPKAAQKTYPGCTIRNTPSEPIHCIVWAKHLFNQLFGEDNAEEDVSPDTADPEAAADAGDQALANEANKEGNIERVSTRKWVQNIEYNAEKISNKLFDDDIKYLLSMENLWKTRKAPTPMNWSDLKKSGQIESLSGTARDQNVWNLAECARVFETSVLTLKDELGKLAENDTLVWDKDDRAGMDFVAACANIRAAIFGIALKSRFEIKSMAGNIIPAIATTNAITAGIVVLHAFKVLTEEFEKCQTVYIRLRPTPRNQLFVPEKFLSQPNPKCYVCSPKPEIVLKIDTEAVTIKEMRDDILIKSLNMINPDVIIDGKGVIVISSEEGETDDNNEKKLNELSITDGTILKVDDFHQNYELSITILHNTTEQLGGLTFAVIGDPDQLKAEQEEAERAKQQLLDEQNQPSSSTSSNNPPKRPKLVVEDDDDCVINDDDDDECEIGPVVDNGGAGTSPRTPLKRRINDDEDVSSKKRKIDEDIDDNPIEIDDDD